MGLPEIVLASMTTVMLLIGWHWRNELAQAIADAINRFRGGPPTNHPLPANDGVLVRRRRKKQPDSFSF